MIKMKKIKIKCKFCHSIFSDFKSNERIYCSKACGYNYKKGKTGAEIYGIEKDKLRTEKISKTMKKKIASGEIVVKIPKNNFSVRNTGNKTLIELYGQEKAIEIRKKLCKTRQGRKPSLGRVMPEEEKERRRQIYKDRPDIIMKIRRARLNQVFPFKDSEPEKIVQGWLSDLSIEFVKHKVIEIPHFYQCDAYIPSLNLVVECDGDYWHGNLNYGRLKELNYTYDTLPAKVKRKVDVDKIRNKELIDAGYKVLRLWEHEIKSMSMNEFKIIINMEMKL